MLQTMADWHTLKSLMFSKTVCGLSGCDTCRDVTRKLKSLAAWKSPSPCATEYAT